MQDIFVLIGAAGIAGSIVWKLTAGTGASIRPRGRRPVRFEDAFEVTALPVSPARVGVGPPALAFRETASEPARPVWSAIRLIVLIASVAAIGAAGIYFVVHFVNQALANRLTGP
ncbi:MAG: hypothetical protein M3450_18195 [Actinomycetota bacterium]|nr:hypothetical protein [Actinomycetota bacterium]